MPVVEQISQILQQKLAAHQFDKLLLLLDDFAIFFLDAAQAY